MAEHKPVYRYSLKNAAAHNEREQWRESHRENCECARAVEDVISDNYHDNILEDVTGRIIEHFGFDRVNWVLANTVRNKMYDGRFSRSNKEWAQAFYIPNDDAKWDFCVGAHPGLTDIFINQTRRAWQALNLFDNTHCSDETDYTGKLLLLKPSVLKDEYKSPDFQLFYAQSGFGCIAAARGRKVFGFFLKDGEKTSFNRSDFIGVIKDKHIPEWAREKLAMLQVSNSAENMTENGTESENFTAGGTQDENEDLSDQYEQGYQQS